MDGPADGKLTIDLHGRIAAILRLSAGKKASDVLGPIAEQLVVVAGVGFGPVEPVSFTQNTRKHRGSRRFLI